MNLDSFSAADFADDYIRSNVFLLAGESDLFLKYWTEHRGVEAGEALVVDYLNSSGNWVELDRVVSDGVTQNNFVFHEIPLPANAYHNGFRIEFRTEGSDATDDWYIDDVAIDDTPACPFPVNYCVGAGNSVGPGAVITSLGHDSGVDQRPAAGRPSACR